MQPRLNSISARYCPLEPPGFKASQAKPGSGPQEMPTPTTAGGNATAADRRTSAAQGGLPPPGH